MKTLAGYNVGMKCIVCEQEGHMVTDLRSDGPYCDEHHSLMRLAEKRSGQMPYIPKDKPVQKPSVTELMPTGHASKDKRRARFEVLQMVGRGELTPHRCWACGVGPEGNAPWHPDPTEVTKVKWYCQEHHPEWLIK